MPRYAGLSVTLGPGDRLSVHADGIAEARSPAGELFGADRLLAAPASAGPSVRVAAEAAAARWSGPRPADEDRTVLVLCRDLTDG